MAYRKTQLSTTALALALVIGHAELALAHNSNPAAPLPPARPAGISAGPAAAPAGVGNTAAGAPPAAGHTVSAASSPEAFSAAAPPAIADSLSQLLDAELGATDGLTADVVASRTVLTSPAVRGKDADLEAAKAALQRATLAYVPTTTLTARYTRLSDTQYGSLGTIVAAPGAGAGQLPEGAPLSNISLGFDYPLNQYALSAGVTVPVSDYFLRLRSSRAAADLGVTSATNNLESIRRRAAKDGKIAYYDWVRARLGAIVAEQALTQARAHLSDAQTGFRLGTVSNADVLRVESQVAQSELLVTSSQNLSALTEERLRTAQHDSSGQVYRIGEDVRRLQSGATSAPIAELWSEALRSRPELTALDADRESQRRLADVERASYVPRVDVFGNVQYSNPNSRVFPATDEFRGSWDTGVQLTWVLSDAVSASAKTAQVEARADSISERRAELVDSIRLEVLDADQDVREARVATGTSARGLAAAEESYRARRLLYQNGRATTVELLDAETDLTRARLDALGAFIDSRIAAVQLDYALGRTDRAGRDGH